MDKVKVITTDNYWYTFIYENGEEITVPEYMVQFPSKGGKNKPLATYRFDVLDFSKNKEDE